MKGIRVSFWNHVEGTPLWNLVCDSFNDFGMVLESINFTPPSLKSNYVSLPAADGEIEVTRLLLGRIPSGNLKIDFGFVATDATRRAAGRVELWKRDLLLQEVMDKLHGKELCIILSDDGERYYRGVVEIGKYTAGRKYCSLTVSASCHPEKKTKNTNEHRGPDGTEIPGETEAKGDGGKDV